MNPIKSEAELDDTYKDIVKEKDPDQFIDLLCASHYFAGKFGNNIPVQQARLAFEEWLDKHTRTLIRQHERELVEARIDELEGLSVGVNDMCSEDWHNRLLELTTKQEGEK